MLADNVVPRIGVLAPDAARAAIREMFLAHVIGGKHLSSRADFTAMVRGATPDVVLTGVELLARGLDEATRASATSWSSTSAARPPTCTASSRSTPRTARRGSGPRGRRDHPGHPHRRGRPRHALVGGHHGRGGGPATTWPTPRPRRHDDPGFLPDDRRRARRRRGDRPGRGRAGAAPARRPVAGWSSAPRAGSSSAPARTCARSTCWSARAACCATGGRASPSGSSPAASATDVEGGWQLPRARRGRRRRRLRPGRGRAARRARTRRRRTGWCCALLEPRGWVACRA